MCFLEPNAFSCLLKTLVCVAFVPHFKASTSPELVLE